MKVCICTIGRYHVADLARELSRLGYEVALYSVVPAWRLRKFGLPGHICKSQFWLAWPLLLLSRLFRSWPKLKTNLDRLLWKLLDWRFSLIRAPGDVFVGMSGLCYRSLHAASKRGAITILERGSRHILSQKRILEAIHGSRKVPEWAVPREVNGYSRAHLIMVGSRHCADSFAEYGHSPKKVKVNPYGVDLEVFKATSLNANPFDVIYVGSWSLQKGCDILVELALERLGLSLLHVGPKGDFSLPTHSRFVHAGPVDQYDLPNFYAKARVFAFPSRQDGFGMVLSQALASGLPVVGSRLCGASDIGQLVGLSSPVVQAVGLENPNDFADALENALSFSKSENEGPRDLLGPQRDLLGWKAYGDRYSSILGSIASSN